MKCNGRTIAKKPNSFRHLSVDPVTRDFVSASGLKRLEAYYKLRADEDAGKEIDIHDPFAKRKSRRRPYQVSLPSTV